MKYKELEIGKRYWIIIGDNETMELELLKFSSCKKSGRFMNDISRPLRNIFLTKQAAEKAAILE